MKKILVVMMMFFVSFPMHAYITQRSLHLAGAVVKGIGGAAGLFIAAGRVTMQKDYSANERTVFGLVGGVLLLSSWRDFRRACKNDSDKKLQDNK